jgi:phosphotriesterase-related protein
MKLDTTGYTYAHEHLHIDLSGFKNNLDCRLDQYDLICQEMRDLLALGVRNIIEPMPGVARHNAFCQAFDQL